MSKIAIFASGAGSNAAVITKYFNNCVAPISVNCYITNSEGTGIYEVSEAHQVPIFKFENQSFKVGKEVIDLLKERRIDWIVLAGFLRKIPALMVNHYENKIINLHPSLLPKYGGKGMYGKHVHEAVLANKEKESGITIHLVNQAFDKGEIIFQKSLLIDDDETTTSLSQKIQQLEHTFFPKVIEEFIAKN